MLKAIEKLIMAILILLVLPFIYTKKQKTYYRMVKFSNNITYAINDDLSYIVIRAC